MKLTSTLFENSGLIPSTYTCDGADINPPLVVSGVPKEAKSLVLIMDDPDAPMGTWDHWVVFNIPPDLATIEEGSEPTGVKGLNSSQKTGYSGPCPPDREHRYFFKLYALDVLLSLKEGALKKEVEQAMAGHILAKTEIIGRYNRN
ncbi:MAG TPA: YbhB/YbcL family Raf kinase inhibitor-like protein [Candidatus Paceibacterota bacterium]|nr:YbhB/YbcL family Raf kinase inhibitor-like protein [Candidatus Paceibacterota bacterium]